MLLPLPISLNENIRHGTVAFGCWLDSDLSSTLIAFCCSYHEDTGAEDNSSSVCFREDGLHWSKEWRTFKACCKEGKATYNIIFCFTFLALPAISIMQAETVRSSCFQPFADFFYKIIFIWCSFLAQYARIIQKLGYPAKFKVMHRATWINSCQNILCFLLWHNEFCWQAGFQDPEYGWFLWCEISDSFGGPCLFSWCLF